MSVVESGSNLVVYNLIRLPKRMPSLRIGRFVAKRDLIHASLRGRRRELLGYESSPPSLSPPYRPSLAGSDCKAMHSDAACGRQPFWRPGSVLVDVSEQVLGRWPESDRMIVQIAAGVFPDIPLTPAVRALTIPGLGFPQFGGGQLPRLSPRASSVQCSFQIEIETRNAEAEAGEMNRSKEPAIDPGVGLGLSASAISERRCSAISRFRRMHEAKLISPLPLTNGTATCHVQCSGAWTPPKNLAQQTKCA